MCCMIRKNKLEANAFNLTYSHSFCKAVFSCQQLHTSLDSSTRTLSTLIAFNASILSIALRTFVFLKDISYN